MQIEKDIFNKEQTYYISSEELEKDIEYVLQNDIKNVGVNLYKDYSLDNIDRLIEKLPFIEKLHIGCRGMNLEPLSELNKLQFLSLMDDNYNVDFSGLENLKHLFFTYDRSFKGLEKLINLETVIVSKANSSLLSFLASLTSVKSLELKLLSNFDLGELVNKGSKIEKLILYKVKNEIDLAELSFLKNTLKELRIYNTKKIVGYEVIKTLKNLEILVFSDCNKIDNVDFIEGLSNLKQLTVVGTSYFKDGNINSLQKEGLTVGIDNKRHYSLKSSQFLNYFRTPPEKMP